MNWTFSEGYGVPTLCGLMDQAHGTQLRKLGLRTFQGPKV